MTYFLRQFLRYNLGPVICIFWLRQKMQIYGPKLYRETDAGINNHDESISIFTIFYSKYFLRPQAFLLSELMDWICEMTNRDPVDYNYKRTELFFSPYTWAKTIAIQMAPLGQKKWFGPHSIERLERVSSRF